MGSMSFARRLPRAVSSVTLKTASECLATFDINFVYLQIRVNDSEIHKLVGFSWQLIAGSR
jgi:hypothetical protein